MRPWRIVLLVGTGVTAWACSLIVDTSSLSGGSASSEAGSDVRVVASDASVGPDADADAGRCSDGQTDPSLVLYLPFDEESGTTATDCSGGGHDGTVLGGVAGSRVAGHSGKALLFDGTQTCVDLGAPSDFVLQGPFTVAVWIKVDEYEVPAPANDSRTILSKTVAPTARGWRFVTQGAGPSAGIGFKVGTDGGVSFTVPSPAPQPVSTWLHAAGVWVPNTRAEVYIGGALVKTVTTIPPILEDVAKTLYVGCVRPDAQHFKGTMDELRIYTRALTQAEIAVLAR